ncbi:hypothetical protein CBR_g21760 [Chara braunii]|uniref:Protein kinase domain-containing protein n=1 Tax=Chara braunii TaxID=69332 RepID=A0A388L1D7_CHABU|nr:hypothetical protein CBR_g21760 [Chara braunii]|eukprot:GBG76101.1 hypothetical protein CBR_g21760 [Chara braunii]
MATTGAVCPHPKGLQLVREGEARLIAAAAVSSGSRGDVASRPQPSSVVASGVSKRCRLDRVHRDHLSKTPRDEGKRRAGNPAVKGWSLEYARLGGSCGGGGGRGGGVQLQSSFWGSSWSCCIPCSFSQQGRVSTRSRPINPSPFPSYCKGQCSGTGSLRSAVRPHCYVQSYSQKVSLDLSAKPCRLGSSSSIGQDNQRHSQRRGDRVLARVVSSASGERQLLNADDYLPREFARSSAGIELLELERGVCNPFKKYSPEGVRARAFESPGAAFAVIARGLKIVCSLGLYWANVSLDVLFGRDMEMVPYRAEQLRNLLVDLGPSFIKSGQVLANRPDIIRADYMEELCILQDDVPAFPSDIAFRMIEEDLGQPLTSVFSKISKTPVAAASLGQVYRGTLAKTGEEIAIKVQRPGIEPIIYRDLFLFRMLASFVNGYCLRKLGCNGELIVDEFAEKLLEELDYKQEARNIEDFYRNFEGDPTVKIPRVYKELSSSRVLVMEWIDGIRCTDPQAIWESGIDVNAFITIGVSSGLRQLLEFGLFHGDPHPGNIFAMRDGRIAYVDFGNVAELSQFLIFHFCSTVTCLCWPRLALDAFTDFQGYDLPTGLD